jgi:hypothetical protein
MTDPRGGTLPKGDVVVHENLLVATVCEIALLSIPKVRPDVIGYVAGLYVYYLFHGWLWRRLHQVYYSANRLEGLSDIDNIDALEAGE